MNSEEEMLDVNTSSSEPLLNERSTPVSSPNDSQVSGVHKEAEMADLSQVPQKIEKL